MNSPLVQKRVNKTQYYTDSKIGQADPQMGLDLYYFGSMANTLGSYVAQLRSKKDLSQDQLADASGIPKSTIQRIENGTNQKVSFSDILKLSKLFGVPVTKFAMAAEGKDPEQGNDLLTISENELEQVIIQNSLETAKKLLEQHNVDLVSGALEEQE